MFDRDFSQSIVDFSNFDISQIGDALAFGGAMLLIGMVAIFAVLCILWACLAIFQFVFHDMAAGKGKKQADNEEAMAPIVSSAPVVSDDGEVIAAIAAAIAMAESESSDIKFRVVSFRRK